MKSLLQQVQSRISKRRHVIHASEQLLGRHYTMKRIYGNLILTDYELRKERLVIKAGAADQQLDKKIFAYLLNQDRNKYEGYFRSAHKPVGMDLTKNQATALNYTALQKHLSELGSRLGVSLTGKAEALF